MSDENNVQNQPATTEAGAIQIDEAQLDQASGGATDFLLEIDGIKGESRDSKIRLDRGNPVLFNALATGQH